MAPHARVRAAREPDGVVERLAALRAVEVTDPNRADARSVVAPVAPWGDGDGNTAAFQHPTADRARNPAATRGMPT